SATATRIRSPGNSSKISGWMVNRMWLIIMAGLPLIPFKVVPRRSVTGSRRSCYIRGVQTPSEQTPSILDGPGVEVSDPRELLLGYLDWYRDALLRKIAGLSDTQLRTPLAPLGWSPLGLVKHLGWVERRWMRWGFAAEDI